MKCYGRLLGTGIALATPWSAYGAIITFEELGTQPGVFMLANPLRMEYVGSHGANFTGQNALDGGAILNQSGNFGANAHSGEHFLAFNTGSALMNGGIPRPPETITFSALQSNVSIWAANATQNGTYRLLAYDALNNLVDSDSVFTVGWNQLSVAGANNIDHVVLDFTSQNGWGIFDDLEYNAVPEPATMAALGLGLAAILKRRRR